MVIKKNAFKIIWFINFVLGLIALSLFFKNPSGNSQNLFLGYSATRLGLGLGFFIILVFYLIIGIVFFDSNRNFQNKIKNITLNNTTGYALLTVFWAILLGILAITFLFISPVSDEIPLIKTIYNYSFLEIIWVFLTILFFLYSMFRYRQKNNHYVFKNPINAILWVIIFLSIYIPTIIIFRKYTYHLGLRGFEHNLIILGCVYLIWGIIQLFSEKNHQNEKINSFFIPFLVFITTFVLIQHFTFWVGWRVTPAKSYWDLLANAFIHGRMYLIDPPSLLDLTMYDGKWFVPNPPLPALLLTLPVYLFGINKVNVVDFSIFFSSINSVILYLSLQKLNLNKWINLSKTNFFVLLVLFSFGTVQFWVSVIARMWFLSQIVTLTFVSLAILFTLYNKHPLIIGICFGLAIFARPNVFTIWLFLLFLFIQINYPKDILKNWKGILKWSVFSAVPVFISVLLLLLYNKLRFDNYLDFGYVSINGAQEIIKNVQTYGMFNFHFFTRNFTAMFLMAPTFSLNPFEIHISGYGMSIFITTPGLIYLFHKYEKKLWVIGGWISILITTGLLLLYHNTGFRQFGYRYILDFITPLFFMLAHVINNKKVVLFYLLVIISITFNIFGASWYIYH